MHSDASVISDVEGETRKSTTATNPGSCYGFVIIRGGILTSNIL